MINLEINFINLFYFIVLYGLMYTIFININFILKIES